MKKINHQYGQNLKNKFDTTETIHFVEDCHCYLGVKDKKFSVVCDYQNLKETFKIKQEMLIEYEFESKEECIKFIQNMIFIAPYNTEEIIMPKSLK